MEIPFNGPLLLHVCCAPCSGGIIERLIDASLKPTILFYNPNIYPAEEYARRKDEVARFAKARAIAVADLDYDPTPWQERIKGLETEPEGGARCRACFALRMERTALYAHDNGFTAFATSLGISRWKNLDNVNAAGHAAATRWPGLIYWDMNWRKAGGTDRMAEVTKREDFYRQTYCGCVYSLNAAKDRTR